jgi:ketose-bisphosphate aldolase
MSLVPMADLLKDAQNRRYAVGAFNITDIASLQGVVHAAEEENSPAIIQTSASSTVKYYGYKALYEMIASVAAPAPVPIALHLDHCKDLEMVYACIDSGWTSVMYDGSSFPFAENLQNSQKAVDRAHRLGVSVEGEIGAVWGVEEDIQVEEHPDLLADPELAVRYARESGVDAFAPAIGTAHGLYKGEPKLDFDRLQCIVRQVDIPIVIHGGTGLSPETFRKLIGYGAAKINVSTQLKIGFFDGCKSYLASGGKVEPVKLLQHIAKAETELVREFINIFGSNGKA